MDTSLVFSIVVIALVGIIVYKQNPDIFKDTHNVRYNKLRQRVFDIHGITQANEIDQRLLSGPKAYVIQEGFLDCFILNPCITIYDNILTIHDAKGKRTITTDQGYVSEGELIKQYCTKDIASRTMMDIQEVFVVSKKKWVFIIFEAFDSHEKTFMFFVVSEERLSYITSIQEAMGKCNKKVSSFEYKEFLKFIKDRDDLKALAEHRLFR